MVERPSLNRLRHSTPGSILCIVVDVVADHLGMVAMADASSPITGMSAATGGAFSQGECTGTGPS
jgi:hypothetical protein